MTIITETNQGNKQSKRDPYRTITIGKHDALELDWYSSLIQIFETIENKYGDVQTKGLLKVSSDSYINVAFGGESHEQPYQFSDGMDTVKVTDYFIVFKMKVEGEDFLLQGLTGREVAFLADIFSVVKEEEGLACT